jgi:hypothetical protein
MTTPCTIPEVTQPVVNQLQIVNGQASGLFFTVTLASVVVGPNNQNTDELTVKATGIGAPGSFWSAFLQPLQEDAVEHCWTDEFALQIIENDLGVSTDQSITFRVRRLDAQGIGWGQNLTVTMLVVTTVSPE